MLLLIGFLGRVLFEPSLAAPVPPPCHIAGSFDCASSWLIVGLLLASGDRLWLVGWGVLWARVAATRRRRRRRSCTPTTSRLKGCSYTRISRTRLGQPRELQSIEAECMPVTLDSCLNDLAGWLSTTRLTCTSAPRLSTSISSLSACRERW